MAITRWALAKRFVHPKSSQSEVRWSPPPPPSLPIPHWKKISIWHHSVMFKILLSIYLGVLTYLKRDFDSSSITRTTQLQKENKNPKSTKMRHRIKINQQNISQWAQEIIPYSLKVKLISQTLRTYNRIVQLQIIPY